MIVTDGEVEIRTVMPTAPSSEQVRFVICDWTTEQDHRGIKGRIRCMRGFKSHNAAKRFCREHGELRDLLRPRRRYNQIVCASSRRAHFAKGARIALEIMTFG